MIVRLLEHTPNPERLISLSAKLCYSPTSIQGLEHKNNNLSEEQIQKFLNMLTSMGHESPVEHVSFTFAVEGVSRALTHQLVRHRIASYSQQSQRYVSLVAGFEFITPPAIADSYEATKQFKQIMEKIDQYYFELSEILRYKHLDTLVEEKRKQLRLGENEPLGLNYLSKINQQAEKMAIEDARYVLPNACETKIIFTMNARTLMNFFKHRCCNRAQWEIREMADEMLVLVREIAPTLFKYSGASCTHGKCPEGSMSCGTPRK